MKLVVTVVQDYDSDKLLRAITGMGLGATRINSTGGFLRMSNATVLSAVRDEQVIEVRDAIRKHCAQRVEVNADDAAPPDLLDWYPAGIHEVPVGGSVAFVLPLERLVRIWPDRIEDVGAQP